MIDVKTYQDLQSCGADEKRRMDFIRSAISEHKSGTLYKTAADAMHYYNGENPSIMRYEKIIYDLQGKAHVDMYTANHKIASSFFTLAVDQGNSYLLGNGVSFKDKGTKNRLGTQRKRFDQQVSLAGEYAMIGGVAFGFWNLDHIDVFQVTEFVPFYNEDNGALMAGVRFWQIDDSKPLRATLYETDGYTDYVQRSGKEMQAIGKKRSYQQTVSRSEIAGTEILDGWNYPSFPIVPLKNTRDCRSAICGKRNTIDALDLVTSNMVNNVDEGNLIYWVLSNCCGMDDLDDAKFLDRLRTTHVVHTDSDSGTTITPQRLEAPVEGTKSAADTLEKRLYQDFQAFDASAVQAGNQTATAIKASYVPLDLKTDKFERQVTEFINGILELAGIDDEPSYTRNKIINVTEEIQAVLLCTEYLDAEYITRKLLTILGDADMVEAVLKRRAAEDLKKFDASGDDDTEVDGDGVLNASKTSSLISVIKGVKNEDITEEQAVKILNMSIGVGREEALAIIRGDAA